MKNKEKDLEGEIIRLKEIEESIEKLEQQYTEEVNRRGEIIEDLQKQIADLTNKQPSSGHYRG